MRFRKTLGRIADILFRARPQPKIGFSSTAVTAPTVTALSPGSAGGGPSMAITATGFVGATGVSFGAVSAWCWGGSTEPGEAGSGQ
jgi:hypothetical protein